MYTSRFILLNVIFAVPLSLDLSSFPRTRPSLTGDGQLAVAIVSRIAGAYGFLLGGLVSLSRSAAVPLCSCQLPAMASNPRTRTTTCVSACTAQFCSGQGKSEKDVRRSINVTGIFSTNGDFCTAAA